MVIELCHNAWIGSLQMHYQWDKELAAGSGGEGGGVSDSFVHILIFSYIKHTVIQISTKFPVMLCRQQQRKDVGTTCLRLMSLCQPAQMVSSWTPLQCQLLI